MNSFLPSVLALILFCSACQRAPRKVIGVVPKGASHIFWQTVHAGAVKAAREAGYEVEWNAPTLEIDSTRQIQIVDSMINRRLSALVLAPVDDKALVHVVERATRSGIPVAIFDSAVATPERLFYVATDNKESGRLAARRMGEICHGQGSVGVIGFMPGSATTTAREAGFAEELARSFPRMNIVSTQYCMADRAKAVALTENILTGTPDLAGVFADNESSSVGAVRALKGRNNHTAKLVAYDASESLIQDLQDGWIDSIVVQNPFKMGYEATRAVTEKLAGHALPRRDLDSGAVLVRREDLARPDIHALLFPDIQQYLR